MTQVSNQVIACITNLRGAWKLLDEAIQQSSARCANLRLVICNGLIGKEDSPEGIKSFLAKLRHAAETKCRDSGVRLLIETLDCEGQEPSVVAKMVNQSNASMLIVSDSIPGSLIAKVLPRRSEAIVRATRCSVLLIR